MSILRDYGTLKISIVFLATSLLCAQSFGESTTSNPALDLEAIIQKIERETSNARTEWAMKLAETAREVSRSNPISADTIDEISGLLKDRDDPVRYWAALALGQIGPPASRAVPALESALKKVEEEDMRRLKAPEMSSAYAIHDARRMISPPASKP